MEKIKWLFMMITILQAGALCAQDVPPHAQPGKCYAWCVIPDQYETKTVVYEAKSSYIRWESLPIGMDSAHTIRVLVKPETQRFTLLPAVYDTIAERILVKPAFQQSISIAPTFETVSESVQIKPETKRIVEIPAIYETVYETILVKSEGKRLIPVEPTFETVSETVLVKPESKRFVEIPAIYETVFETYEAESPSEKVEILQPRFESVTEPVKIREKEVQWVQKQGDKNCLSKDPKDCLIWCLVEMPAVYQPMTKTVNKGCDNSGIANSGCVKRTPIPARMATRTVQKVKNPASFREEIIPAEYATVTKQVLKTPATVREEVIPAEYKTISRRMVKIPVTFRAEKMPAEYITVTKQVLKTPAAIHSQTIDNQYITVTKQVLKTPTTFTMEVTPPQYATQTLRSKRTPIYKAISMPAEFATYKYRQLVRKGGFSEWREIVCSHSPNPQMMIRKLQKALKARGYDTPVDNVFGPQTKKAFIKFQKDRGLPIGNLGMETMKALGLDFNND